MLNKTLLRNSVKQILINFISLLPDKIKKRAGNVKGVENFVCCRGLYRRIDFQYVSALFIGSLYDELISTSLLKSRN